MGRHLLGRHVRNRLPQMSRALRHAGGPVVSAGPPMAAVRDDDEIGEMARSVEQFLRDRSQLALTRARLQIEQQRLTANRLVLREWLAPLGFDLDEAGDGHEAVERAVARTPDLVIMDLSMPGQGGEAAMARIHRIEPLRPVPIMAVSTAQDEAFAPVGEGQDASVFLPKPVDRDRLLLELGRLLGPSGEQEVAAAVESAGQLVADVPGLERVRRTHSSSAAMRGASSTSTCLMPSRSSNGRSSITATSPITWPVVSNKGTPR